MQIEVIEVKPVAPPPKEYILRLNQNELDLITGVLGCISGYDGENGWKKIINHIYDKVSVYSRFKDTSANFFNQGVSLKNIQEYKPK